MDRPFLPFYFPTNVALLDDDTSFLKHFSLLLDPHLPCRTFSSASSALECINNQSSLIQNYTEIASVTDDEDERVFFNLSKLRELIHNHERYSQISVAIIDYDMPEMNGLEVCRKINGAGIKKILLTGKADEKIAVEAFNNGLIHHFIQKSSADADKHVNDAVKKLQLDYFNDLAKPFQIAITDGKAAFLGDSKFKTRFSGLIRDNNIIEFYLWDSPMGILMLNAPGNTQFMFVMPEEVMRTQHDMALACEAPRELLNLLEDGKHIPWFPTPDGYYNNDCKSNWRDNLYPVNFTCGPGKGNFCSLVSPPPSPLLSTIKIVPFERYLQNFDAVFSPPD